MTRRRTLLGWILLPLAIAWTELALRRLRTELAEQRIGSRLPPPALRCAAATRVAGAWLGLRRATCLERSLVLQRWLYAEGKPRNVLVGVSTEGAFRAHAWLDDEPASGYEVIARLDPLTRTTPLALR